MSDSDLGSVREALQEGARAGAPAAALVDAWATLGADDPDWQAFLDELLTAGAALHPSIATAATIEPAAVATAVVGARGQLREASASFRAWVGDPLASPDGRRLIQKALAEGRAIGLVAGADGRMLSLFARRGSLGVVLRAVSPEVRLSDDDVVLVAFAPSKSSALAAKAAEALGLTPLEGRVAEAMLDAPSLATAAEAIGVGRETAKDALERAMKKAGVRRASELVGRMVDLACEAGRPGPGAETLLREAMSLSPSEARVALALGEGRSAAEAATDLGLSEATVKSYRRTVFDKAGVGTARDLGRLVAEVTELDRIAGAAEVATEQRGPFERLRVTVSRGRRIAFIDYGPASGAPLIIGHGFTTGRLAPPAFVAACHKLGLRPVIPQRPGFGLTDPAPINEYLETAAADLAAILDRLGQRTARLIGRDGGVATFLAFDAAYPGRLERPLLLNPRAPNGYRLPPDAPMSAISRVLRARPRLVEPFAEMMRRQTRSDVLEAMLRRTCSTVPADRALFEDAALRAHAVRDMQGLMARSMRGFVAEHHAYASGWAPPGLDPNGRWTIAYSEALWADPDLRPWAGLPGLQVAPLVGAGHLAALSHMTELLALVRGEEAPKRG